MSFSANNPNRSSYVRRRSEPMISVVNTNSAAASAAMKEQLPEAGTVEMTEAFHEAMEALETDAPSKVLQQKELRMKREIMRLEKEVQRAEQLYQMHRQKMEEREQREREQQES
ncbi:uncharacterized protein LOC142336320 [Convolutriloba macropyga]|uniref:uncharacterized protein LOC142336320 n=1 Tax=Convolutriloba macropyga TaxID=536237 RepID=UPI003F51E343